MNKSWRVQKSTKAVEWVKKATESRLVAAFFQISGSLKFGLAYRKLLEYLAYTDHFTLLITPWE